MLAPQVRVRKTAIGVHRHAAQADHVVSVHVSDPVRISCPVVRGVRLRGDINVFPAGVSDDGWFEDDEGEMIDVRLPGSLLRTAAEEMGLDPARASVRTRCHLRDERIEHIARALAAGEGASALYRESLGMALAVHLLEHHRAASPALGGLSKAQLVRVTEYVEAHLAEDVTLLRLARVAGVSTSHLRALFKRSMGVAVHEYVIQRRVERARLLLQKGELPASQIAIEAGFSHQSHMARCMRRTLGITPTQVARLRH